MGVQACAHIHMLGSGSSWGQEKELELGKLEK